MIKTTKQKPFDRLFHLHFFYPFVKMSDTYEQLSDLEEPLPDLEEQLPYLEDPFRFDKDNIPSIFKGNFQVEILHDGRLLKIRFDSGEFTIMQVDRDEYSNHVFQVMFFEGNIQTCLFWGLIELERQGFEKHFIVTSHDFSTEVGVNALRQILPDGNISESVFNISESVFNSIESVFNSSAVSNHSINLNDRFADVASRDDASAGETPEQS